MQTEQSAFRTDIEGLRAVAVLLVVLYHAHLLWCSGGFVGVDVFFVISGYLITGLLTAEGFRTHRIAFWAFYARRIRRLLPASTVMLVATVLAARFLLPPYEQAVLSRSVLATSAYLSNVYFAHVSGDYFAPDMAGNALLHTWSLAVEEQFYFLWPILIFLILRIRRSRPLLCAVMGALGAISLATCLWMSRTDQPYAFFLMPSRAWEFAAGGLASQIPSTLLERGRRWAAGGGWIGLSLILVSGWTASSSNFPGVQAILPVLATTLVLIAGSLPAPAGAGNLLGLPMLRWIGQRSYAIYLWHWPILVLTAVVDLPFPTPARLACVLLSGGLAEMTYRLVERPFRTSLYLQRHAGVCLVAALALALVGVGGSFAWRAWALQTSSYKTYGAAMLDLPADSPLGCENGFGQAIPHECDFGSTNPEKIIVLFGDSHMEQWLPAFQTIATTKNWKIALFVKSSCPPLALVISAQQSRGEDHWCRSWRDLAFDRIRALHPDLVVLSAAVGYTQMDHPESPQTTEQWFAGARQTFERLQQAGLPTVFLRDTPLAGYQVTQCLGRADWDHLDPCPTLVRRTAVNDPVFRAETMAAEGLSKISLIDMSDQICGEQLCNLTVDGTIVYRDASHLTAKFLRTLSRPLDAEIVRREPQLAEGNSAMK